jgi:hypothetical protein
MISISNKDAAIIQALLERGHKFYRIHAVRSPDQNDARLMAKMAKKLKVNRAAATSRPKTE